MTRVGFLRELVASVLVPAILTIALFVPGPPTASGELNPPPPFEGLTVDHAGDWTIEPGDASYRGNGTLVLRGNLTIQQGGGLTLRNVSLLVNSSFDGEFGITVEAGAALTLVNSTVSAYDATTPVIYPYGTVYGLMYRLNVSGSLTVANSTVSHIWGGWNREGGLRLDGGSLNATDSVVSFQGARGVYGLSGALHLNRSYVSEIPVLGPSVEMYSGTMMIRESRVNGSVSAANSTVELVRSTLNGSFLAAASSVAVLRDNTISRGGIQFDTSRGVSSENVVDGGGICLYTRFATAQDVLWENNTVRNCTQAGMQFGGASPTVRNVSISNARFAFALLQSSPLIENVTLTNITQADAVVFDAGIAESHPKFLNTSVNVSRTEVWDNSDNRSDIEVAWFLHVHATLATGDPVPGASVQVFNIIGQEVFGVTAGADGWARWSPLTALNATDRDGDRYVNSPGEIVSSTPHTVRVSNGTVTQETQVVMDRSRTLEFVFGRLANVTVTKEPQQGQALVDGVSSDVPAGYSWLVGSTHAVEVGAVEPGGGGTRYFFLNWSDGGDRAHAVLTPDQGVTLTAYFRIQHRILLDLPGTGADHPVLLTFVDNGTTRVVRTWDRWEGWVDSGAAASSSDCAVGEPLRCAADVHEWTISAPLNATVRYSGSEGASVLMNLKPFIAAFFALAIALVGLRTARKATKHSRDRSVGKVWAVHVAPWLLLEVTTGLLSLLTGVLAIPPPLGVGTAVDAIILAAGLAVPFVTAGRDVAKHPGEELPPPPPP